MGNRFKNIIFLLILMFVSLDSSAQMKSIKVIRDGVEIVDFDIYGISKDSQKVLLDKNSIDLEKWQNSNCDGFILHLKDDSVKIYRKDEFLQSIDVDYLKRYLAEIKNSNEIWYLTIDTYPFEKNISESYDELVRDVNSKDAILYNFIYSKTEDYFIKYRDN